MHTATRPGFAGGQDGATRSENWEEYRMKRRQFLTAAGAGLAATAIAAPAIAQSMPELKWRMPCSWPKSLDTLYGAAEVMCKVVGEMTDNKFQIQPFAAGEIVPGLAIVDAVQNGTVEMRPHRVLLLFRQGSDLRLRHVGAVRSQCAHQPRLVDARRRPGSDERVLQEVQSGWLLAGNTGCQMGGWFRKEINTVDDLKGVKMRIGGWAGKILQKLGGVPQQIAAGDIYPALEKGTIDAAEWVGPYDDEKLGFYKVAPHYYAPGWWEGGSMLFAMVNLDKWNALAEVTISAFSSTAGHYANTWCMAKYDANQPASPAPPARRRRQAARVFAADHGRVLQGDHGTARRGRARRTPTSRRSTTR